MHVRDALTKEANMSIGAKFALTAAIALSMVATAAAAPRQQKNAAYRASPRTLPSAQRAVPFANPYSPEATGGGSIGYNKKELMPLEARGSTHPRFVPPHTAAAADQSIASTAPAVTPGGDSNRRRAPA